MASSRRGISSSSSSSSLEELEQQTVKNCRIDCLRDLAKNSNHHNLPTTATVKDMPRREENPFSFKHFLNQDSSNYHNTGAKPKVFSTSQSYTGPSVIESTGTKDNDGVYTRNPTELPDFVQDHLVIEQCYLNQDTAGCGGTQIISDVDNLPDFTLNSVDLRPLRDRGESIHERRNEAPIETADCSSNFRRLHDDSSQLLDTVNFPLDLPVPPGELSNCSNSNDRNHSPRENSSIPKSLPDFLNDGPIRNRVIPQSDSNLPANSMDSLDRRLQLENEILQHNLEIVRRQNNEKSRRIQMLEAELFSRRAVDHEETAHLEKAMEQVEDNLKRSTRRAVNAESTVTLLKQELEKVTMEAYALRAENRELKNAIGDETQKKIRVLAGDLKEAASSAESLLKQLMSGVNNLQIIASALENIDKIEDKTTDFLLVFDDDNATGSA